MDCSSAVKHRLGGCDAVYNDGMKTIELDDWLSDDHRSLLEAEVGSPLTFTRLPGVGGPGCYRVQGLSREAIFKYGLPERESFFYREWAPRLQQADLAVPRLLAAGYEPTWILLERLPTSLPPDRWQGDPEVLRYLATWHRLSQDWPGESVDGYGYTWNGQVLNELMGFLDEGTLGQIAEIIAMQGDAWDILCKPITWIHGDPNPTNWLLTASGTPALIDWSRYGRAHPAIDLAISMPGLPPLDRCVEQAEHYLRFNPELSPNGEQLGRSIALGKLWTLIDFLGMAKRGELSPDGNQGVKMLTERLGTWINSVFLGPKS